MIAPMVGLFAFLVAVVPGRGWRQGLRFEPLILRTVFILFVCYCLAESLLPVADLTRSWFGVLTWPTFDFDRGQSMALASDIAALSVLGYISSAMLSRRWNAPLANLIASLIVCLAVATICELLEGHHVSRHASALRVLLGLAGVTLACQLYWTQLALVRALQPDRAAGLKQQRNVENNHRRAGLPLAFEEDLSLLLGRLLRVALDDDDLAVRRHALESLAYSGEIAMRQLIEDAYYAPEEEMRISALNAMGRSADVRWRNLTRAELENPAPAMRAAAATASGALENRAAVPDLTDLLADDVAEVKLAAIAALGQIGGKEVRELLEAMRLSDDPAEVEAADLALEELMFAAEEDDDFLADDVIDEWEDEPWTQWRNREDPDLGAYGASDEDDEEL